MLNPELDDDIVPASKKATTTSTTAKPSASASAPVASVPSPSPFPISPTSTETPSRATLVRNVSNSTTAKSKPLPTPPPKPRTSNVQAPPAQAKSPPLSRSTTNEFQIPNISSTSPASPRSPLDAPSDASSTPPSSTTTSLLLAPPSITSNAEDGSPRAPPPSLVTSHSGSTSGRSNSMSSLDPASIISSVISRMLDETSTQLSSSPPASTLMMPTHVPSPFPDTNEPNVQRSRSAGVGKATLERTLSAKQSEVSSLSPSPSPAQPSPAPSTSAPASRSNTQSQPSPSSPPHQVARKVTDASKDISRQSDMLFNPLMIYTRTLTDDCDYSTLTIPDIFLPNYNVIGFNYAPESETIGTRLRLLILIADNDDLIEKFDVSESPLNYYDYTGVPSSIPEAPLTSFPQPIIPYQLPPAVPNQPSTTPLVNPALAQSFSNLKKLFPGSVFGTSSNPNTPSSTAATSQNPATPSSQSLHGSGASVPLRGTGTQLRQTKPMESPPLPPGYDPYFRPKPLYQISSPPASNTQSYSHTNPSNPSNFNPFPTSNPAKASFVIAPVASNIDFSPSSTPPAQAPMVPIFSPLIKETSAEASERKSRRKAALIDQKELSKLNNPEVEPEVLSPVKITFELTAAPDTDPEPSPDSTKDFQFTGVFSQTLQPQDEEVFRRHRGVSMAEDQLLAKLNDFGDFASLDLGLDSVQENESETGK